MIVPYFLSVMNFLLARLSSILYLDGKSNLLELKMGHDRRLDVDRRMVSDRRFGKNCNKYNSHERRSIHDQRGYSERRQVQLTSSKIDLFQKAL